jgi:ABC-2 type transport system permease protein
VAVLFIIWLSLAIPSRWTPLNVLSLVQLAQPLLSLLGILMFFGVLALLLSLLLPARRLAAMTVGILLVGSFFLAGLANVNADLEPVAKLTPLYYYQGGDAIDNFNLTWFVGLLVPAVLFAILAWWRFQRRDIRVGGEGGWQRPTWSSLARLRSGRLSDEREVPAAETATAQR